FLARVLVRTAVSTALVTPWAGAGLALAAASGPPSQWQMAAAMVLAIVAPGVYAARLVETRAAGLEAVAGTGRIVRARAFLEGLTELTGDPAAAKRRRRLDQDIATAAKAVAGELSPEPSVSARLIRASALIHLDRAAEAEAVLLPLAETDPVA